MLDYAKILCPAKLNLFLSVGPVDRRGYHPIRSIFQAISLYDTLELTRASSLSFECDDPDVPRENNTVLKAAKLMMEVADFPPVHLKLVKSIPSQAGLGGGSSDAAGVILAGKSLMRAHLPDHEMLAVADAVGADVAFFLLSSLAGTTRARAEGYGSILTAAPSDSSPQWFVVAQPDQRSSTKEMYKCLDSISYPWLDFPESDILFNDFERVAPPESIRLIGRLLDYGAGDAGLTGSGSAVFGRFPTQSAAEAARTAVSAFAPFAAVAKAL